MAKSSNLSFLEAAEVVLREHRAELTAEDIVRLALDRGDLRTQGATPETAMRARLATDIVQKGLQSRFQRVGPNRFVLREWERLEYESDNEGGVPERVACIPRDRLRFLEREFGLLDAHDTVTRLLGTPTELVFLDRPAAEASDAQKQIIAYVLLEDREGNVLRYQRGAYSTSSRFLQGSQCIGFGGHVTRDDAHSLFGRIDGGVLECARRELSEELPGLAPTDLRVVGVISDNSSPSGLQHLGVVLRGLLPPTFSVPDQKREAGISRLQLVTAESLWREFDMLEFWSQLLVRRFHPRPSTVPRVALRIRRRRGRIVALVGAIATGKTEVASYLAANFNVATVSTRECVADLVGLDDFGTSDRSLFQARAAELVQCSDGIDRLATAIGARVDACADKVVLIDGIRQIGTIERLRRKFPEMRVLFVDTPRDRAYEFFCSRAKRAASAAAVSEFREARSHQVEREVALLRYRADATIFNDGSLPELYGALQTWWNARP